MNKKELKNYFQMIENLQDDLNKINLEIEKNIEKFKTDKILIKNKLWELKINYNYMFKEIIKLEDYEWIKKHNNKLKLLMKYLIEILNEYKNNYKKERLINNEDLNSLILLYNEIINNNQIEIKKVNFKRKTTHDIEIVESSEICIEKDNIRFNKLTKLKLFIIIIIFLIILLLITCLFFIKINKNK